MHGVGLLCHVVDILVVDVGSHLVVVLEAALLAHLLGHFVARVRVQQHLVFGQLMQSRARPDAGVARRSLHARATFWEVVSELKLILLVVPMGSRRKYDIVPTQKQAHRNILSALV